MNYKIIVIDNFKKEAKKLLKKYSSLKSELEVLNEQLLANPKIGVHIGNNFYKIRLAVKSKGKGKSGGLRVITFILEVLIEMEEGEDNSETTIFLASIYDKSVEDNISVKDLKKIIDEIQNTNLE